MDINLTKESSPLFHAIHSTFYWWILKKTMLFSGFKNPYKKKTIKLDSIHEWHFVEHKNEDRKPDKNSEYAIFYRNEKVAVSRRS